MLNDESRYPAQTKNRRQAVQEHNLWTVSANLLLSELAVVSPHQLIEMLLLLGHIHSFHQRIINEAGSWHPCHIPDRPAGFPASVNRAL